MATSPKVVSLSVRPFQVAHLCFEVDGILDSSGIFDLTQRLGTTVSQFDLDSLYTVLKGAPTGTDPSLLLFNSSQIQTSTQPFTLASLRAEGRKAALDKAIMARQNAYYAKYANAPAIIARMNQDYSNGTSSAAPGLKPNMLGQLVNVSQGAYALLNQAYNDDNRTGVVRTTTSALASDITSYGYSAAGSETAQVTASATMGDALLTLPPQPPPPPAAPSWPPPAPQPPPAVGVSEFAQMGFSSSNNSIMDQTQQQATSYQVVSSADKAHQDQTIVNTDYGYRVPSAEAQAQFLRAQISLVDQQFAAYMYGQNLPNLAQVFQNELNSIDLDVYRLQIAYLNTLLTSPIQGVVTGIYKNPGDAVKAGEPVIRVEGNGILLLTGTLVYRGPIAIGSTVTVKTSLFGSATTPATLTGTAVAVRGRREDDQWEVVVQCNNVAGNTIPLGYHFDYDDTTVSIT
jgi:biotin carboxyl carrier protein